MPHVIATDGERKRLVLDLLFASDADVLLLDEPTDNLDIDSCEALEGGRCASSAKAERTIRRQAASHWPCFEGTLVAVSHDRAFLRRMDRFLMVLHDGTVLALPDYDSASQALLDPDRAANVRLATSLTDAAR